MIDASEVLKELTQNSKDFEYEKYIKKITFQKDLSKNNHFIFSIPNIFILKWIKHKYSTLSEKNLLNKDNIKIDFILSKNIKNKQKIPIQKKEEDIKSVEKKYLF